MKLNKKGFTLVELLAVIIILAIVIGITIPAVLSTINSSRKSGGKDAAEIVANWVDDQTTLAAVDVNSVDKGYLDVFCGGSTTGCSGVSTQTGITNQNFFNSVGLKATDIEKVDISFFNNKACIVLYVKSTGSYQITADGQTQRYVAGKGCGSLAPGHYVCANTGTEFDQCTSN